MNRVQPNFDLLGLVILSRRLILQVTIDNNYSNSKCLECRYLKTDGWEYDDHCNRSPPVWNKRSRSRVHSRTSLRQLIPLYCTIRLIIWTNKHLFQVISIIISHAFSTPVWNKRSRSRVHSRTSLRQLIPLYCTIRLIIWTNKHLFQVISIIISHAFSTTNRFVLLHPLCYHEFTIDEVVNSTMAVLEIRFARATCIFRFFLLLIGLTLDRNWYNFKIYEFIPIQSLLNFIFYQQSQHFSF